eukprot:TRINITY_DN8206_c0_g1_i9.p1 TRINITY_DN8206_c0_g1~~TRINITY_DN8206_c0_g1_i9.p1  ORF type:complete len:143 (+),score=21.97 TRINITY_DN8206_c0_g1_i9:163-591(+)
MMTCVGSQGHLVWNLDTGVRWTSHQELVFHASLTPFVPVPALAKPAMIAIGDRSMALVSPTGQLLAFSDLRGMAIDTPVIADFNNDGHNDIVIVTAEGLIGFVSRVSASYGLFQVILATLILGVGSVLMRERFLPSAKVSKD